MCPGKLQRIVLLVLVATATSLAWIQGGRAAELVMFERDGCAWCQRWLHEIGPVYDKTAEAKVLPLRRVSMDAQLAGDFSLASPVRYTPTFVAVDHGREIGRITGFLNDDAFWGLLSTLATRITSPVSPIERN